MSTEILTGVAIADATTLGGQKLVKTASCSVVKEAFPVSLKCMIFKARIGDDRPQQS